MVKKVLFLSSANSARSQMAEAEKACRVFPGKGTREYWPMADPATAQGSAEERLVTFREVRDHLEARIRSWLRERNYRPVCELSSAGTGAAS